MATRKRDKIDKLVDKYKKKSAPIKAREAANQAAKARQLPTKPGSSTMTKPGSKEIVKSGGRSITSAAKNVGGKVLKTVLSPGTKLAARGGLVGLAGMAGYGIGTAINKKYNISGKIADYLMKDKDREVTKEIRKQKSDLPDRGLGGTKIGQASSSKTSGQSPTGSKTKQSPVGSVKTKGGDYPTYKKTSGEAKDFRSQFAAARKAGKKEFTWQGRKYNTKVK